MSTERMGKARSMEDQAGDMLVHYLRAPWIASGLTWDAKCETDIREALTLLINAAVAEATVVAMARALHILAERT